MRTDARTRSFSARRVVATWGSLFTLIGMIALMVSQMGLSSSLVLLLLGVIATVSVVLLNGYLTMTQHLHDEEADLLKERESRRLMVKEQEDRFRTTLEAALKATSSAHLGKRENQPDIAKVASQIVEDISGLVAAEVAADRADLKNERGRVKRNNPKHVVPG